ncbi:MAG: hypothetical protein BGP12_00160 [Rhodospirillales bacterium 70-18]|nr:MAG: hypothetical protein BGP12_00160 [Rhodospirillales bacterium 70-18]
MIHELRTYTFHPGKLPAYMKLAETVGRPARGNRYGVNHGYWTTEFGTLNQIWHLWSYDSLDERTRLRADLQKNEAWVRDYIPNILPLMQRQDIRLMNPVKDITPPAEAGGIYEVRMYRARPGKAREWAGHFKDILPVREKYSKNVGLWVTEAPQPNELVHMWNYPSVEARMKTRAAVDADPDWQGFRTKVTGFVEEMQSFLLIPTPYSAMK